jgi:hypothetical protein
LAVVKPDEISGNATNATIKAISRVTFITLTSLKRLWIGA